MKTRKLDVEDYYSGPQGVNKREDWHGSCLNPRVGFTGTPWATLKNDKDFSKCPKCGGVGRYFVQRRHRQRLTQCDCKYGRSE